MTLEVENIRDRIEMGVEMGVKLGNWAKIRVGMSCCLAHFVADPKINEGIMSEAFYSMSQQTLNATEKKIRRTDQQYTTIPVL